MVKKLFTNVKNMVGEHTEEMGCAFLFIIVFKASRRLYPMISLFFDFIV